MKIYRSREFTADRAWGATELERLDNATVRIHWTDQPYIWHINDGPEIFVVLDGIVDMQTRGPAGEKVHRLGVGDVFHAAAGDEHRAQPIGEARVLVVERAGSI